MYVAIDKRRENIAEYILYIWQLEDMLRALQFSPEAVYSQLIKPYGLDAEKEHELLVWYMDIVNLLKGEGKEQSGHIEHTIHLINDLQRLHEQLMSLPVGESYRAKFINLSPELPKLRQIMDRSDEIGDIELCFRALYAVVLYRIKGDKSAQGAISDVIEVVSPVIAELASMYRRVEIGEVDLFREKN